MEPMAASIWNWPALSIRPHVIKPCESRRSPGRSSGAVVLSGQRTEILLAFDEQVPIPALYPTVSSTPDTVTPPATGDHHQWFMKEVQPHGSQLKSYLRGLFPSVRDVDDVVQESYLRIWKTSPGRIACTKAFLFRIGRNVALDLVRRVQGSPIEAAADLSVLNAIGDGPDGAATAEAQEQVDLLGEALASLPETCRTIVVLRKFKDVPQKDVAERLGLTEKAVEHHVARGLKRCEAYLRKRGVRSP